MAEFLPYGPYDEAVAELLAEGLERRVWLRLLPGDPGQRLWALHVEGPSPLRCGGSEPLHLSIAFQGEIPPWLMGRLKHRWRRPRKICLRFSWVGGGGAGILGDCAVGRCRWLRRCMVLGITGGVSCTSACKKDGRVHFALLSGLSCISRPSSADRSRGRASRHSANMLHVGVVGPLGLHGLLCLLYLLRSGLRTWSMMLKLLMLLLLSHPSTHAQVWHAWHFWPLHNGNVPM